MIQVSKKFIVFLIMGCAIVTNILNDIYVPCIDAMTCHYGISVPVFQWSLALYYIGFGLGALLYSILSDPWGRRPTMILGLSIFCVGCFSVAIPTHINFLLYGRFIEGFGAAVSFSLGIPIIRDLFGERDSARLLTWLGVAVCISPTIAPILGAWIDQTFGWHYNFILMAILSFFFWLLVVFTLPETGKEKRPILWGQLYAAASSLLKHTRYVRYCILDGLTYGGLLCYVIGSPFVLLNYQGVPQSHYGYYIWVGVFFYVLGSAINDYALKKGANIGTLIKIGVWTSFLSGTLSVLATALDPCDPYALRIATSLFLLGSALLFPNIAVVITGFFEHSMGMAASLLTFFSNLIAFLVVVLMSASHDNTPWPVAFFTFCAGSMILFIYTSMGKNISNKNKFNHIKI